jgi:tape measure domain-containing protein
VDVRSLVIAIGFKVNNSNVKQVEQTTKKVKTGLERVGDSADKAGNKVDSLFSKLSGLAMFAGVSLTLGSIVKTIDEWKVIEGQVNNVTKSQQESKAVQKEIYNIASRTRQQYGSTAELFTSVARNAQELKKSTKDILLFTEDVSNAMLLGGGDASSQQAALVQLGQALGSGTLRGDELNSILEQAPRLAKAIADGMGTTIGQLRQMGSEGKLTAQDVFNAIRGQSDRLKMELGKMPWTIGQASNKMQNAVGKFFKEFEDKTGIIDSMAKSIAKFADYVEKINLDNFISGLRIAAIYAGVLFGMAKWSSFVMMLGTAVKWIVAVRDALMLATGAQIVFNSQTRKGAAMQMLIMGKFLLIAAAIAFVVLLIQDFYKWITDPTADTMMKRWFGDFDAVKNKANEFLTMLENSPIRFLPIVTWIWVVLELIRDLYRWFSGGDSVIGSALTGWGEKWQNFCNWFKEAWDSVSKAFEDFCNMRVIGIIKLAIDWLGKLGDKIAKTARSWGESLKEKFGGPLWPSIKEGFSNFVNNGVNGTGPAAPNDLSYYGKVGYTPMSASTSVNNSGNQTNYITVNTSSNASPSDIGAGVANGIQRSNGGLSGAIDSSNPAFEYC